MRLLEVRNPQILFLTNALKNFTNNWLQGYWPEVLWIISVTLLMDKCDRSLLHIFGKYFLVQHAVSNLTR